MNKFTTSTFVFFLYVLQSFCQISPFGTGYIGNQNIGVLDDTTAVFASVSGLGFIDDLPDAQQLLQDHTFDIYVPEDYDGTEAYGLVTFINSSNNGGYINDWISVFDDKKIIWIAGDEIGNPIWYKARIGVGMAAALRMQELFNIDPDRIYTSGSSGGARMAHNLAFIYPETFKGTLPYCGGSYIRPVAQDYATGNYEHILNYPTDYLNHIHQFDQRYANLISFDDFREGNIMNIYHNGSEQDGLKGKFLETEGPHCSTTTEQFLDALNFIEHPFLEVIHEDYTGATSTSFNTINTNLGNDSVIVLEHNLADFAQLKSSNLFLWNDPKGAILNTSIQLDPNDFNMNTSFNLGIWSMGNPFSYCDFDARQLNNDIPAIVLNIDFIDAQPTLSIKINNPAQPDIDTLFISTFSDWDVNNRMAVKYHLWDKELRVELGADLISPDSTSLGVRLLDDLRSIRIRWDEVVNDFWENSNWESGAFLTLASEKTQPAQSASNLLVSNVVLITADTSITTDIPVDSNEFDAHICQGETYFFNNENLMESGVFQSTLTNVFGCDSIVTLNLVVNELPIVEISEIDGTISSNETFQTYQWYFNGSVLNGEISSFLNPIENGEYYLEVTDENECINTSNVISYIATLTNEKIHQDILIYPNPTTGELIIDSENPNFEAELFDVYGKSIISNLKRSNDIAYLSDGIYILKLRQENRKFVFKIQKLD